MALATKFQKQAEIVFLLGIYIYIYIYILLLLQQSWMCLFVNLYIFQLQSMNSGNACYYSVQNLLSSRLLSKNITIRIHKTIILSVVLYGCETWSLTLREGV
jgi:hypothetical protein